MGPGSGGGVGGGEGPGGGNGTGVGTGSGTGTGQGGTADEFAGAGSGSGNGNGNGAGSGANGNGNGSGSGAGTGASGAGSGSGDPADVAGNSRGAGIPNAVIKTPNVGEKKLPAPVDLPLRVIGLALKGPSTSFFSNFEVFFAERRLAKGQTELIKLVYIFLPYQRRLTEYGLGDSRVFKLRVTRDPSCDESLLQMTWAGTGQSENNADTPDQDSNNKLPCYRTTADDYKRAIGQR